MSLLVKLTRSLDRGASRHRGFVTVLVLAAMALLAALVMEAQARTRARLSGQGRFRSELPVQAALHDGVREAMLRLADDENLLVDHLQEPWAKAWDIPLTTGLSVRVEITDACARFDLNNLYLPTPDISARAPEEIAMDLMTSGGDFQPAERAAAIRDWIDPDQDGLREKGYYETENLPFRPANRALASLAELEHVAGFSREFLQDKPRPKPGQPFRHAFRDLATVLPVPRQHPIKINLNTAPEPVLQALLGVGDSALVRIMLVARQNGPLTGLDLFLVNLDPRQQNTLLAFADVRSEFFEIRARAYQTQGPNLTAQVLVHRDATGKVQVIRWMP